VRPAPEIEPSLHSIARRFVEARLAARPLADFPGRIPTDLVTAYACQDLAIEAWPDTLVGWKVGWIPDVLQPSLGEERLIGPIFARELRNAEFGAAENAVPVFAGGFAAIEAEYVFRLAADAPAERLHWSVGEAAQLVAGLSVAIEIASSPLASINQLGPTVVVCDFGNNGGLLLGPQIQDWSADRDREYLCRTEIEDRVVGRGGSGSLAGGPLAALAFALGRAARRGRPLRAGQLVTTGASTGIHDILPGQRGRVVFEGLGEIRCRAVAREPDRAG
jgi:2-keto-4-pentenoate hydratase